MFIKLIKKRQSENEEIVWRLYESKKFFHLARLRLWRHITVYETCEVNGPFKGEIITYWIFHSVQFIVYWSLLKGFLMFFFLHTSIITS